MGLGLLVPAALFLPRYSGANCHPSLPLISSPHASQWRELPLRPAMQSQQPAARAAVSLTGDPSSQQRTLLREPTSVEEWLGLAQVALDTAEELKHEELRHQAFQDYLG